MRENVGQYIDACAELGLPQRELFITADLFDNKDFQTVLRNIEVRAACSLRARRHASACLCRRACFEPPLAGPHACARPRSAHEHA